MLLALAAFALAVVNAARLLPFVPSLPFPLAAVAVMIVAIALWLFLIRAFARGRNWARFVFAFLCFVSIPRTVLLAVQPFPSVAVGINVLSTLLDAIAAVLLFTPTSSAWFRAAARRAPTA